MTCLWTTEVAEASKSWGDYWIIKINKVALSTALLGLVTVILEYVEHILAQFWRGFANAFSKL